MDSAGTAADCKDCYPTVATDSPDMGPGSTDPCCYNRIAVAAATTADSSFHNLQ